MPKFADIIVDISAEKLDRSFQYKIPASLETEIYPGVRVSAPFGSGGRVISGYVISVSDTPVFPPEKTKEILEIEQKSIAIESQLIRLADWIRKNFGGTMNQALKSVIPVKRVRKGKNPLETLMLEPKPAAHKLNKFQQDIADDIQKRRDAGDMRPSLIYGVTGSGKTEVYIEIIKGVVRRGQQAIVLIPEISLTRQTVLRFMAHFGDRVAILNSRMSQGERSDQIRRARVGEADVMIGPRSALFTPFEKLGIIIIDEEHESSYKSETVPRYHAREVAVERARLCGAQVVLGSATPSLESYSLAKAGKFKLYTLSERVAARPLPKFSIIDMRAELEGGNKSIISEKLRGLIEDRLAGGEQTMIFLNRRGMAGFVSCRSCGKPVRCPHCDVSLTLNRGGRLVCHYCGHSEPLMRLCPSCGSRAIGAFKAGTQRVEEILSQEFPEARVLRMDRDTTSAKGDYDKILGALERREADILIGTQMIVKGHDFPQVTLVAALAADMSLNVPDFHASERTYQLLVQAAGRAGRGARPGEMVVQTYQPEHYSILAAKEQDFEAFYEREMEFRTLMDYPPAGNMLVVHLRGRDRQATQEAAKRLREAADRIVCGLDYSKEGGAREDAGGAHDIRYTAQESGTPKDFTVQIVGPTSAPIGKVNDIYRKMFYIKCWELSVLIDIKDRLEELTRGEEGFGGEDVSFDFNPARL